MKEKSEKKRMLRKRGKREKPATRKGKSEEKGDGAQKAIFR